MYVCMHACMYVRMQVSTYVFMYACKLACIGPAGVEASFMQGFERQLGYAPLPPTTGP